jgi:hypothetical protein
VSKRQEYHREYYRTNAAELAERKQEERDNFDQATSYWRQKMLFKREMPGLIAKIPPAIVERARKAYEKVLAEYEPEPEEVAKKANVSTGRKARK